ncbi:MAG: GNAT family N-acetyltransferase [Chloroflexi bacterium]|nr:GNAT family N-acetyltransferase [Chloroflexota bacterium]
MEIPLAGGYSLRPWRPGDEAALTKYANNWNIWINVGDRFPHPYTKEDAREWVSGQQGREPVTTFAIATAEEAIGGIGYHMQGDVRRRSAEIGYWLGEPFWGRGIMTTAVKALSTYAMERHGLVRLYAHVFEWNLASAAVLEKAGFTLEARLKKAVTKNSQTIDELLYALVKD